MVFLIIFGLFMVILPIPGSAVIGWGSVILGCVFILDVKNIKCIKKIRKGIFYGLLHMKNKKIRKYKKKDIIRHIKKMRKKRKKR